MTERHVPERPFLNDFEDLPTQLPTREGLIARGLFLGQGSQKLEVAVYDAPDTPPRQTVREIWKERVGGRPTSVLTVVLYGDRATVCGHVEQGHEPLACIAGVESRYLERLCATALLLPDHHSVDRFLREQLPETESQIFGMRNQGLLATYVIQRGKDEIAAINPQLWDESLPHVQRLKEAARGPADGRDQRILAALGYSLHATPGPASILTAKESKVALAIFLNEDEAAELSSKRFGNQTPISYAIHEAQRENLDWVVVTKGRELRLYPTRASVGVGNRGLTNTYLQVNIDLLTEDRLPLVWMSFSADALGEAGIIKSLLERSGRYAADIGRRLRERIYDRVIPQLSMAIVSARRLKQPTAEDLNLTYEMSMLVLFRLLFIAYAEDHDLLPYRTNDLYRSRSITQKARELRDLIRGAGGFDAGTALWHEITLLWRAVKEGNTEWGVPAYDGGLFEDNDPEHHRPGHELARIELRNRDFGLILSNLLLDEETPEGLGPVDFRSLGVREFGTIYEGLLENELSVADSHLTVDKKGNFVPTEDVKKAMWAKGSIYLHTRSGARKSSGSYYTKAFAVDHLLDHSLEPALCEHLERVLPFIRNANAGACPWPVAVRKLFEFYVADISMGSGHFLISAIDRIERAFLRFLAEYPARGVDIELDKLRDSARRQMGPVLDERWLERNRLLRRLIARRCIYGVDINPLAVELARLSVWIHTFVPGLPLSFLDHNLVCGNSLVGIATFDEMLAETIGLTGDNLNLFADPVKEILGRVETEIRVLRDLADAELGDVQKAEQIDATIRQKLAGAHALFDILTASRIDPAIMREKVASGAGMGLLSNLAELDKLVGRKLHSDALRACRPSTPFHFPTAFPEVFLRQPAGFDVIIGNPPWEEATVEEDAFWARHFPGLRGRAQNEQERLKRTYRRERPDLVRQYEKESEQADLLRKILTTGPYPGMDTGDPDLYKGFCWRFWNLIRSPSGRVGVVLPRSAWFAKGSAAFRTEVFANGLAEDLTYLLNNREWVFPEVHPQYTVVLSSLRSGTGSDTITTIKLRGPYASESAFNAGHKSAPIVIETNAALGWTDSASLPLLPDEESAAIFLQLRKAPRLDGLVYNADKDEWAVDSRLTWSCRPHRELDATNDKSLMKFSTTQPKGFWPVYKGESFDIWQPDTGTYYAWVDPKEIATHLQQKRERGRRLANSVFHGFPEEWIRDPRTLPCFHPRIAFRDVTNRTNRRTVVAALVPPKVVISNQAPYLLWKSGDAKDVAYLLGVLCSIPLDWYARRFVETHVNFHVLTPFPVPRPKRSDPLWRRVVELAARLSCTDGRYTAWATDVGVASGPLKEDVRASMICELDAVVAHLYGLTERQLGHVFETFHEGWSYEERLRATLEHHSAWKKRL